MDGRPVDLEVLDARRGRAGHQHRRRMLRRGRQQHRGPLRRRRTGGADPVCPARLGPRRRRRGRDAALRERIPPGRRIAPEGRQDQRHDGRPGRRAVDARHLHRPAAELHQDGKDRDEEGERQDQEGHDLHLHLRNDDPGQVQRAPGGDDDGNVPRHPPRGQRRLRDRRAPARPAHAHRHLRRQDHGQGDDRRHRLHLHRHPGL